MPWPILFGPPPNIITFLLLVGYDSQNFELLSFQSYVEYKSDMISSPNQFSVGNSVIENATGGSGNDWIIGNDENLTKDRIALALATKKVLANGLGILGISDPEKM